MNFHSSVHIVHKACVAVTQNHTQPLPESIITKIQNCLAQVMHQCETKQRQIGKQKRTNLTLGMLNMSLVRIEQAQQVQVQVDEMIPKCGDYRVFLNLLPIVAERLFTVDLVIAEAELLQIQHAEEYQEKHDKLVNQISLYCSQQRDDFMALCTEFPMLRPKISQFCKQEIAYFLLLCK